jgi:hypothetical protein
VFKRAWCWWLTPVILAIQETEIRRLKPANANSLRDPISKNPSQNRAGGVDQSVGPESKP